MKDPASSKREVWSSALIWVLAVAALAVGWVWFFDNGQRAAVFPLMSLPEATEKGAPSAGIQLDSVALLMSSVALWIGAAGVFSGRQQAMSALATVGAAMAWLSSTLWFALSGCAVTALAGFLSFRGRWEDDGHSSAASLYAKEKCWGLLIAFLGLAVWSADSTSLAGGYALIAGTWFLLPGFPFLAGIAEESEPEAAGNLLVQRVLPALAAAAVFGRFIGAPPAGADTASFTMLAWVGAGMALLAAVYGLVSKGWKTSLSAWIAAGASIGVAVIALESLRGGITYFAGILLASAALCTAGAALEEGTSRPSWAKAGAVLGALLGLSFAGFVTAKPLVALLADVWKLEEPALVALLAVPFFVTSLLGWKVMWTLVRMNPKSGGTWQSMIFPVPLALSGLGLLWTGELSGGLSLDGADQVTRSLMDALLGIESPASRPDDAAWNTALAIYGGIVFLGALAGYWLSGAKDRWLALRASFPRFASFIDHGVGARLVGRAALKLMRATGDHVSLWIDAKLWDRWMPVAFSFAVKRGGSLAARVDSAASLKVSRALRAKAEVPSKLLQLIQNGDVQWYLLFALTAGMAMLAHFMRKA